METYRKLISTLGEYDFGSPEWLEINNLADSYCKAQIIAGNMEFANMVVGNLGDLVYDGFYSEQPEIQETYKNWISWFRKWNLDDSADELEYILESASTDE